MQSFKVDQSCQLARGHSEICTKRRSATAATFSHVGKQQGYASHGIAGAFSSTARPAKVVRPHTRSQTSVLRCAASRLEQPHQDEGEPAARGSLQRQVDRLTCLLDNMQAATTWHDKVGNTPPLLAISHWQRIYRMPGCPRHIHTYSLT